MQTWKCFYSGYKELTQYLSVSVSKQSNYLESDLELPQPVPLWPQNTLTLFPYLYLSYFHMCTSQILNMLHPIHRTLMSLTYVHHKGQEWALFTSANGQCHCTPYAFLGKDCYSR